MRLVRRHRPHLLTVLVSYNEHRFIEGALASLIAEGSDVWLIDNGSTDGTRELARKFLGRGLLHIDDEPRGDTFEHGALIRAKEAVIRLVQPRWAMHADCDERRSAAPGMGTIRTALTRVDASGATAVNFQEFVFVPTAEHPDHDHDRFVETMHWYYPFSPRERHRVNLFRPGSIEGWDLASSAGHVLAGDGIEVFETDFVLRHYPVLSATHMDEKYGQRRFPQHELDVGWHANRRGLDSSRLRLLPEAELRDARSQGLDASDPQPEHLVFRP